MGFLPADNPRYLIVVLVDEPTKNQYGGVVAAPVFREIASRAITYSGAIVPDATSQAEKDDKPDKDKGRQRGLKLSRLDVPFLAKEDVQTSRPPSMQQPGHLAKASSRVPDVKGKMVRNAVELFARAGIVPELKGTARAWSGRARRRARPGPRKEKTSLTFCGSRRGNRESRIRTIARQGAP